MARVLFIWELGGDYGHLAQLIPIARELAGRGHTCQFVVRDLLGAERLLAPHGFKWFQAPLWQAQVTNLPLPISYPEILMRVGFLNPQALTGICRAWINLIDLIQPDLLVCEHSPTALLAVRGLCIPKLLLGSGFTLPPEIAPIPPFRWWTEENAVRLADSEQHVTKMTNEVLNNLGFNAIERLIDLFESTDKMICTFKELDHYVDRRQGNFIGPIFSLGKGEKADWPVAKGPRIFAYLKSGYPYLEQVLTDLNHCEASILVHIPNAARQTVDRYTSRHMRVSLEPLSIEEIKETCDIVVCHGGLGTTSTMLLSGKPMLLLPTHVEQLMLAKRIVSLGAAVIAPVENQADYSNLLKSLLSNKSYSKAARDFANNYSSYDQNKTILAVADRCEALMM